jgi:hypothetical protein
MSEPGIDILQRILATRGGFGHREHLELAWTCLDRYELTTAHQAVSTAVRHVAQLHGMPERYHETITRSWVHVVALHRAVAPGESFDAFIAANPGLLTRTSSAGTTADPSSRAARRGRTGPSLTCARSPRSRSVSSSGQPAR